MYFCFCLFQFISELQMTKTNWTLASVFLLATSLGSAMAADMAPRYTKAPAPVPVMAYSWTGCYIGVEGGGAWGRSRHDGFPPGPTQLTPTFDVSGGLAGGEAGCNYQFSPSWAAGVEGDISWIDKKGSSFDTGPGGNPTFQSTTREHWISTIRGRVGPTWDRVWVYGTGGFAAAAVEANVAIPGLRTYSETVTHYGWTAGVGIEYAITNNWTIKGEYLYVKLDNKAFLFGNDPVIGPAGLNAQRSGVNLNDNIVRVGLNYKFGWASPVVAKY
jgi:outer membrane immunogenic protein